MSGIAWNEFSWDAFATLATGFLAVGAAGVVGWFQLKITSRQTDILNRQTESNELSVKHDLWDRRHAVYSAVANFLHFIVTQATYPKRDSELESERELEPKFFQAIGLSRFYFGDDVMVQLQDIQRKSADYALLKHEMERVDARGGNYRDGIPAKEAELHTCINDALNNLPDLFGDALRLGG